MSSELVVRELAISDVPSVVAVHLSAFPTSAMSRLGAEVVRRNYLSLHQGPHDLVALGAFRGSELAGFCYAGVFRGELSHFLAANRTFLIRRVLTHPWLIANPIVRSRVKLGLRLLRTPEKASQAPAPLDRATVSFGIQSIAVNASLQRSGVGRLLVRETELAARRNGFSRMHLTVHPGNATAIQFYESTGWLKDPVTDPASIVMRKVLTEA
jgi:ribosomal protein S18 acetylase RimI-like enzyme